MPNELNQNKENKEARPSKHSRKFFIITIAVVVLALGGSGIFAYKILEIKEQKNKEAAVKAEEKRVAAVEVAKKKAEEEKLAEAEKLKKEVAEIDVTEIKAAVADLKKAMATFNN